IQGTSACDEYSSKLSTKIAQKMVSRQSPTVFRPNTQRLVAVIQKVQYQGTRASYPGHAHPLGKLYASRKNNPESRADQSAQRKHCVRVHSRIVSPCAP